MLKRILLSMIMVSAVALLGGCCTDMGCGVGTTYVATSTCGTCANSCTACSTCSTCGYDANYTYSGWY